MATKAKATKKEAKKRILVRTPVGQISFPNLVKPDVGREYSDNKYKMDLLFDKATWKEEGKDLRVAVIKTAQEFFGNPKITKLSDFKHPFKDGDDKDPEKASSKAYAGKMYVTLKTEYKPSIMKADGKTEMTEKEVEAIKGGDWARAVVSIYGYSQSGGGITLGLQLVQFWKEGESFGGGSKAASVALLSELQVDLDDVDMGEDEEEDEVEAADDDEEDEVSNVKL